MVLLAATLADGLSLLTPTTEVSEAIEAIATSYIDYFYQSTVLGTMVTPYVLDVAPKAAMIAAMASLNTEGAKAIVDGIQAFWTSLIGIETAVWFLTPPPVIIPSTIVISPGISALESALQAVFDSNVAAETDLPTSATNVANVIHTTLIGGTVNTQVPPSAPVATPIL
jgi:hypothetical protein